MPKLVKNVALGIAKRIPAFNNYLAEKEYMHIRMLEQQNHIDLLERAAKVRDKKIWSPLNRVATIRFITNQLDATGAPLIFMDIIKEFTNKYSNLNSELHTFAPVNQGYIDVLGIAGIKTIVHDHRDLEMEFIKGDVVVLNTSAHTDELKTSIFNALDSGTIKKLVWYIQEDWPHIFFSEEDKVRVLKQLKADRLKIFVPAAKALKSQQLFFGTKKNIQKQPYKIIINKKYHKQRSVEDFNNLKFVMVGKTGEGLKGHLPILYAFLNFKQDYYDKSPDRYRNFELRFIAIEKDYLSLQILRHSKGLGEHFKYFPPVDHEKALHIIKDSNITICYSMRECLPIFVFEGMAMGHPILRNDVSGMEEQFKDKLNGFFIDSNDFSQVNNTIRRVLDKKLTSNINLTKMSLESYRIALDQEKNNYDLITQEVVNSWNK